VNTKVCKKCGVEKTVDQFSVNRAAKDGLVNSCKPCETARVKAWSKANPDKVKAWADANRLNNIAATLSPDTPRKCNQCGIMKTISDFHANPRNKENLRKICKECTCSHMSAVYQENPEKQRKKTSEWRKENPEKHKEYSIAYYAENREERIEHRRQYRLKNIEKEREKDRQYAKDNPAKMNAKNAKRRAAKTQATPPWLNWFQEAQIEEFYELASARTMQTGIYYEVDHIVPLRGKTVRGLHVPWNLQLLTADANIRKKNKLIEDRST
jgi:hypothetical protein